MRRPGADGSQLLALTQTHLLTEHRTGEALLVVAPFGAVALLLMPLAVGTDIPLLRQVGPGFYWLVVLLFGVLLTVRHGSEDGPGPRVLLAQCGVDPVVRVGARIVGDGVLLVSFEIVLLPVAVAFYDPPVEGWPWAVLTLPLVAAGLACLGALAGGVSSAAVGRVTLGPLLAVPLAVPLLLGATQVGEALRYGRPPWPWLLMMATADLTALLGAVLSARTLEETV